MLKRCEIRVINRSMSSFKSRLKKIIPPEEFQHSCVEILDENGIFLTWEKNSEKFLGYPRKDVINRLSLKDILEPPDTFTRIWDEVKKNGYFIGYSYVKTRDRKGIEVFILLWHHRSLNLVSVIIVDTDRFQLVLKEYKTLFDSLPDPIFILDKNFRIIKANSATARALGMDINDILGKTCYEIVHESGEPPENCPHKKLLKDKKPHTEMIFEKNLGGENIVSTTPLYGPDGKLIGSIHVSRNISELKKIQEEYEFFFNYSPSINLILDKNYRILKASKMMATILQKKQEELIGMNFLSFLTPESKDSAKSKIDSVAKGEPVHPFLVDFIRDDLKFTILLSLTLPLSQFGKENPTILSTGLDITPILDLQKELIKTERRYKTIFNKSKDALFILNGDKELIDVNSTARDVFSVRNEKGKKLTEFIGESIKPVLKRLERESEITDFPIQIENNGDSRHYLVTALKFMEGDEARYFVSLRDITQMMNYEKELEKSLKRLSILFDEIISAMSDLVEIRDPYTAGHQRKVAEIAVEIAHHLGLDDDKIKAIKYAGLTHDIGKIAIPSEILTKPGKLTELEYEMIKRHPEIGYKILKDIDFPWPVAEIVYQHHERLDGSGYPRGLKNGEILFEARILAVADVVEAMSSHRPYRPALGIEVAIEEIKKNRGRLYDPEVVDACIEILKEGGCVKK